MKPKVQQHEPHAELDVGSWIYLFLWLIIVVVWIVLFMLLMCKPDSIAIALLEKFLFGGGWKTCVIVVFGIGLLVLIWRKR